MVVNNVQVLAAGTRIDQDQARDGRPLPTTVVTLLVTPEDAERFRWSASVGRITLTLRNPLDVEPTHDHGHARGDAHGRAGAAAADDGRGQAATAADS